MDRIVFHAPGKQLPLAALLARAFGADVESAHTQLVQSGQVLVEGRAIRRSGARVDPGARVEVSAERLPALVEPELRSAMWRVLVPKLPWRRGSFSLAGGQGGRPDRGMDAAGAQAESNSRSNLKSGAKAKPRSKARQAVIETFERSVVRGPSCELVLSGPESSAAQVLAQLARAGWPVLGDARRGGILIEGGPRIRAFADEADLEQEMVREDAAWWPREPIHPDPQALRAWAVSAATARVIRHGHPWILPDEESDAVSRFRVGSLVPVVDPSGKPLATAYVEGDGRIAGRIWTRSESVAPALGSAGARVEAALARREKLIARGTAQREGEGATDTDALRLVHGEADGLPGLHVDRLGALLRILVTGRAALPLLDDVVHALRSARIPGLDAMAPIVEVLHLRDRPSGDFECVRLHGEDEVDAAGRLAAERSVVHERGLAFYVEPGLGEPNVARPGFGLYLDQRENRARLAKHARRGGRWLNLFCHTGAFSVALLAAGAEEVVSVDLSGAYLGWLDENLALNAGAGVDAARHTGVRKDGRRYLEALPPLERFDGIVLDPPTAAAAGRRFWSADRDLTPLIATTLARLSPGGRLLVCRNTRGAKRPLEELVGEAAGEAGIDVSHVEHAGPGPDFPRLRGFPEGESFQGRIVLRR